MIRRSSLGGDLLMKISRRILSMRVFVCLLGLVSGSGCIGTTSSGTGFPNEVRNNVNDFLVDLAREVLAAMLL